MSEFPRQCIRCVARSLAIALAAGLASGIWAAPVAEIKSAEGLTSVVGQNQAARYVVPGDGVEVGETISTSRRGFAMLAFTDGSRVTLRPSTTLRIDKYEHGDDEEAMRLTLLKGGVRALSGLITERNPEDGFVIDSGDYDEVRIHGTATDVRRCGADCLEDAKRAEGKPRPPLMAPPVGSVVSLRGGRLKQTRGDGKVKGLILHGPIYPHDTLETAPPAFAVLAFRDNTRVTMPGSTIFAVDEYHYDASKPQSSSVVLRLIQGAVEASPGRIGETNPEGYRIQSGVPRGGGSPQLNEVSGAAPPHNENFFTMTPPSGGAQTSTKFAVDSNGFYVQGDGNIQFREGTIKKMDGSIFMGSDGKVHNMPLPQSIVEHLSSAPAPESVHVDLGALFGTSPNTSKPGLYVLVWEGHVTVGEMDLGGGESGWVDQNKKTFRLSDAPAALLYDPTPRPGGEEPLVGLIGRDIATKVQDLRSLQPAVCVP